MDFKTTYLKDNISNTEELFSELNELKYGMVGIDHFAFDATHYMEANELPITDYKMFSRVLKSMIENILKEYGRQTSEIFYVTPDGHVWITSELTFLFLAFANPEMLIYFNNIIGDALTDGVAYTDGFVYSLALNRLPKEALSDIIKKQAENERAEDK